MLRFFIPRSRSSSALSSFNHKPGAHIRRHVFTTSAAGRLASLLRCCSNASHLRQTHGFMVPRGLDQDNFLLSTFIHVCSVLGFLDYGYSAFSHKAHPDVYLYNTMIKAYSAHPGSVKEAITLYNQVQANGLRPDSYTLPFALKAIIRLSSPVHLGMGIHCQAIGTGLDDDVHVATALIQMYSSCRRPSDARKLFDGMCFRDVASWNAIVAGYAKVGDMDGARDLFERTPGRDVISWTTVIAGYVQVNQPSEAITVFQRMQLERVKPDEVAMLAVLSACAQLGAFELGQWIHKYIDEHRLNRTVPLNNALIDMYAKSGDICKAINVFRGMKNRSVVSWTTIIAGLALHGRGRESLEMFTCMEKACIKPNDVTLIAVLSACSHVGSVEMGRWYFNNMDSRYGIKPKIEHYGCMVDLLGRAGCLQEAQELVKKMPFEANEVIWGSLLSASRIHGNVELGERALHHLIRMEPHNSGNYTILSNIYATIGCWKNAGMVRKVMRDTGIKKMPGGSFIEVNNRVNEFNAGDRSHHESEEIHKVLSSVNKQLKMAGYVLLESEEGPRCSSSCFLRDLV